MFYVYFGYVSPDHHDSSDGPTYEVESFDSEDAVLDHHKEFMEGIHEECSNVIYRVFQGAELKLAPVERVTTYELQRVGG